MSLFCRLFGHSFGQDDACKRCGIDRAGERVPSRGLRFRRIKGKKAYALMGTMGCTDTTVILPAYYRNCPVCEIAPHAFSDYPVPYEIAVPDSITSIGKEAFASSPLRAITFGEQPCALGEGVFCGCHELTSPALPCGITELPPRTFALCTALEDVTLPDSVRSIGEKAFAGCTALTHVTYSDNMDALGAHAFEGCVKLSAVSLPRSMTALPDGLLCGCESLAAIELHEGITALGERSLAYCTSLTELSFPTTLTTIGAGACQGCTALTSITLPPSLTDFPTDENGRGETFDGCTSLTTVELHKGIAHFPPQLFGDCSSLTSLPFHGTSADWRAICKAQGWDEGSATYVVHCVNGRIRKGH